MGFDVRDARAAALGVCWSLLAVALAAAAEPASPNNKSVPTPASAPAAGAERAIAVAGEEEIPGDFRYHLQLDNNLAVHAAQLDVKGVAVPVRAKVTIAQDGQIIASVRTDEWGRAQVVGLRPAVFSVLAVSEDGFAAFRAHVAPFDSPEEARKRPPTPKRGSMWQTPLQTHRQSTAVEVSLVPASEYQLMKSLVQHKGAFSLFIAKNGEIVDFIRPGENWVYGLSGRETGCYSLLGAGVTRGSRGFYAYRVYHVAAAKAAPQPKRPSTQLLPGSGRHLDAGSVRLCQSGDDDDSEMTMSPIPAPDFDVLQQMVTESGGPRFGVVPAGVTATGPAEMGMASAAAAGGAGLGGLLGAAGAGLAGASVAGGGGEGGGGGGGGPATNFLP